MPQTNSSTKFYKIKKKKIKIQRRNRILKKKLKFTQQ